MADIHDNPIGTRGFAFVEYTGPAEELDTLFAKLGFTPVGRTRDGAVTRYKQNRIEFFVNSGDGQPARFRDAHKAGANAMGFLVDDPADAFRGALARGAQAADGEGLWTDAPAIRGIGGSLIYFVRNGAEGAFFDAAFEPTGEEDKGGAGLTYIDHLTHNVVRGNMKTWADFYENVFNFREIRYFDIEGKLTGLLSKAMTSPDGNIRIPLNESQDDKSQIEEFIREFDGEGIQHIALGSDDIHASVEELRRRELPFQDTPDTYYDALDARIAGHGEDLSRLRANRILMDGAPTEGQGLLLQIFTQNSLGPIFFEIIQRKGNEGFGEGNFKALFESIELDQIQRGVLDPAAAGHAGA
ncbi:MAG: 4-hydroxyphenylpyruvate dioxygenase [Sphingomonadaceae bacterium]